VSNGTSPAGASGLRQRERWSGTRRWHAPSDAGECLPRYPPTGLVERHLALDTIVDDEAHLDFGSMFEKDEAVRSQLEGYLGLDLPSFVEGRACFEVAHLEYIRTNPSYTICLSA
jgi:hypothetical protein